LIGGESFGYKLDGRVTRLPARQVNRKNNILQWFA